MGHQIYRTQKISKDYKKQQEKVAHEANLHFYYIEKRLLSYIVILRLNHDKVKL